MALIGGSARDRVRARADARLAGIALRAGVVVVAGRTVGLGRVRAEAGLWVTRSNIVALIGRGARDRARARADASLADIGLCAGVAVVAGRAVGFSRV